MPDAAAASVEAAWSDRAAELAEWAWARLVNRTEVWGGYNAVADREKVITRQDGTSYPLGATLTRPRKWLRGRVALTPDVLVRHFRAQGPLDVVGLHTTSPENTSRAGTIEADWHGATSTDPEVNWRAVRAWFDRLRGRGFHPLLWDSNGKGGFHLDVLLAGPIATPRLFHFLRDFVSDYHGYGLPKRPEHFPKQPSLCPTKDGRGQYGNWVRVVGRHHTRNFWARVWDGQNWLDGADAVAFILALKGDPPGLVPDVPPPQPPQPRSCQAYVSRAGDNRSRRIAAYMARLPNLGEGQGRDDIAYRFAVFLVRDLALPDHAALPWLEQWDRGNSPPKGRECLTEILANARRYGRNPYGCGLGPLHTIREI
jgi:hypothetical protein